METRSNHVLVGAVTLILLAMLALFTIWLARVNSGSEKEYDIFFKQAVDGLNKGSPVAFSGVPSGQVKDIALMPNQPEFVRVRITVNPDTPVLLGTTATVQGVGFTGVSQVALDGAQAGRPPISCENSGCPAGAPMIPTRAGGLGALLNSAPKLLERVSTLTERLTELLSDRNQNSIAGILANTNRLTNALADRGPEIAATLAETRVAIQKAGVASQQIGDLAATSNGILRDDVKPTIANLNTAIASAQRSMSNLDSAIGDAKPAIQGFSRNTLPEVNALVNDLRVMAGALSNVAEKIDRGGASSLIGSQRLPDYEPKE